MLRDENLNLLEQIHELQTDYVILDDSYKKFITVSTYIDFII